MPIKSFLTLFVFLLASCTGTQKAENPMVGKWSTTTSCESALLLSKNHQISGQDVIGTWEERKDFAELNIAQKSQGKYRFVQVLVSKPSAKKMNIIQVVYPEETWAWPQKIGDTLYKCG